MLKGFVLSQLAFTAPCFRQLSLHSVYKISGISLKATLLAICTEISGKSLVPFNPNK